MQNTLAVIAPLTTGRGNAVSKAALSVLGIACRAVEASDGELDIVLLGPGGETAAADVVSFGARSVYTVDHDDLKEYTAEAYARALEEFLRLSNSEGRSYGFVCTATSSATREFLPRVAAALDFPMASDVVGMSTDGDDVLFTRAVFVGNLHATVRLNGPTVLVTCRPSAFDIPEPVSESSRVAPVELKSSLAHARKRFMKLESTPSSRPDLSEADVVVSVGRGTKGPDQGIPLAAQLADVMGAALGATRAVVDAGWLPNELQVGQTGKIVAPQLYVALGLSGAIQHLAGMRSSKTVVAINKDVEAPIFEVADLGLVADLFEAVPALTQAIEARQSGG